MTNILLTKNPSLSGLQYSSVQEHFVRFVNTATEFNVATGFITNDSIATLQQIIAFKNGKMKLNLFIGMHYIEGFTKIQYKAVKELADYLKNGNIGSVYLSTSALFHGKMYTFLQNNRCLGGFIGSSNLGSFVGKDPNYIEADAFFAGDEGLFVNKSILDIISELGQNLSDLPPLTKFIEPTSKLLKSYHYVSEVNDVELAEIKKSRTGLKTSVSLKTKPKSNLNTYFGAGKTPNKYSPRGWYEVELIIGKKESAMEKLPTEHPITVVTEDGYSFQCERQGDYFKNFRSRFDLKILGRWIKGQMENDGTLELGKPVTDDVLREFGKSKISFEETSIKDINGNKKWYITLE